MVNKKPLAESLISPKIAFRETADKGNGMFASEPISAGEAVLIWGGTYTDRQGAEAARRRGLLAIQWDEDLFSVEDPGDDPAYFINHSCDADTWMQGAFTLVARRDIAAGEEITADYALWEADNADHRYLSKWSCQCGAPDCRGRVTGNDWRLPPLQAKYQGHFSPLINKLITAQNKKQF